jgi:NADH-quinone oxidoreductase subunit M
LLAGSGVVLGAVYMLSSYRTIVLGEVNAKTNSFSEINTQDKLILIPIVILIFVFGLFPDLINNLTSTSVNEIINQYQTQLTGTATN